MLKESFEKDNFEKKSADDNKSMKNYPACKELEATDMHILDFYAVDHSDPTYVKCGN